MGHIEAPTVEQLSPINFTCLNDHTWFVSHNKFLSLESLSFAPPKVQNRLMLNNGWCGLGTVFVPPGEMLSLSDLKECLQRINCVNAHAERPDDPEIIIRTAGKDVFTRWLSPTLLIRFNGQDETTARDLSGSVDLPFDEGMGRLRGQWKIIHGENPTEQRKTIHGKIHVSDGNLSLDFATGAVHARVLEGSRMIALYPRIIPGLGPTNIRITMPASIKEGLSFLRKNKTSIYRRLKEFVDFMPLPNYVIDFRFYIGNCNPDERFHILDIDSYWF